MMPEWPEWFRSIWSGFLPDWSDILDLNLINVLWTLPAFIGSICVMVHLVWTWQRWRATVTLQARSSTQAAAFWFFRQDVLSLGMGMGMTAAGVLAMFRVPVWPVWCLLVAGVAFMLNKAWNIIDDQRVQFFVQERRQRR